MNRPPALPQPGRNFWRGIFRASLIAVLLWTGIAFALSGCAVATTPAPEAKAERICWNMTKQWHFKDGCNVLSAWRYQVEI